MVNRKKSVSGKTALRKDIFREIKKSLGRFMAILLIVAVGVGFFVGVKATAPSMHKTAEKYFTDNSLMDIEVLSTVGFGEEDAKRIAKIDHVEKVYPTYSADLILKINGESQVAKTLALTDDLSSAVNCPILTEGRMPKKANECLLTKGDFSNSSYSLGDKITFEPYADETEVDTILSERSYTIVGMVDLPQFISYSYGTSSIGNGNVSAVVLLPQDNFLYPRFTEMYLTLDCHKNGITAFDEEYDTILKEVEEKIEKIGKVQCDSYIGELRTQLEAAEEELNGAQGQLDAAKTELDDAKTQIDEGQKELDAGWAEYEAGSAEAKKQIQDGERQLQKGKDALSAGKKDLEAGKKAYSDAEKKAKKELNDSRKELDDAWDKYHSSVAKYNDSLVQYNDAKQVVAEADELVQEGKQALAAFLDIKQTLDNTVSSDTTFPVNGAALSSLVQARSSVNDYKRQLESLDPSSAEYKTVKALLENAQDELNYLDSRISALQSNPQITKAELDRDVAHVQQSVDKAEKQLSDAKKELDSAKKELDSAKKELDSAKKQLDGYEKDYDSGKAKAESDLRKAQADLKSGEKELRDSQKQITDSEKLLAEKKKDAQAQLDEALKKLNDSQAELDDAKAKYEAGLAEYNKAVAEAEEEMSSGMNRIQNARNDFNEIVSGKWYVLSRDDVMVNYSGFKQDADRINAIADVFPVFFLLVAALVCLTTMSRMIDEQRTQIGTYKALGYTHREIASKYLIYAGLACIGGCILGPAICVQVLPRVIFGAYGVLYKLPYFLISVPVIMLIVSVIVALLCTVLVAGISCWKELRTTTASLMRPKAPKVGKKIFLEKIPFIWNRFSFFQKLTARNLLRYKIRLFMTVIGIAGCMALVVAGFGLQDAISPIARLQYDEISHDDLAFSLNQNYTLEEMQTTYDTIKSDERIERTLVTREQSAAKVYDKDENASVDDVVLYVPQDTKAVREFLNLRDPKTKAPLTWSDDGVIVSEKISRALGVKAGDDIILLDGEKKIDVHVAGVAECYIQNYLYMTPNYYEKAIGEDITYNTIYALASDKMGDHDEFISEWLSQSEQIIMVYFTDIVKDTINDTLSSLIVVVFVMILCAGLLAFIVLYNLTNINLSERVREIATVKVLGFHKGETNMYIFRENLIMCILGILLGCALGYLMAQYMINMIEVSMVMFSRKVLLRSYLYSAAITLGFAVLVNLVMTRRIKAISMVESLKAIE